MGERPRVVSIIGWVFLILGASLVIYSGSSLYWIHSKLPMFPKDYPNRDSIVRDIVTYQLGLLASGMYVTLCATGFLKLRPWARRNLEIMSLLGIAGVLWIAGRHVLTFYGLVSPSSHAPPAAWDVVKWVIGTVILVPALAIAIWHLRGRAVRHACSKPEHKACGAP